VNLDLQQHAEVGGRSIVIVDDNEDNIIVLQHLLKKIGYTETHHFSDSTQVIPTCLEQNLQPDLFLLDVMMPRIDGIELARQIKSHDDLKASSIIFVTAREMDDTLERCFEVGGADFVSKPVSMVELRCRLTRIFEVQDLQRTLKKQNEELRVSTLTDPLTNVFNRRYLDCRLTEEVAKGHRYGHELSFLMLDIDHFKAVNDELGHGVGDVALIQLAELLSDAVRSTDMVARYGGEEFCIMLTGTSIEKASDKADRIRESIAQHRFFEDHPNRNLTVSIGIAANQDCPKGIEELMHKADQALYEAKHRGRNQVVTYHNNDFKSLKK
jgi:diguanylate cyclase (GGDEF)-like protein